MSSLSSEVFEPNQHLERESLDTKRYRDKRIAIFQSKFTNFVFTNVILEVLKCMTLSCLCCSQCINCSVEERRTSRTLQYQAMVLWGGAGAGGQHRQQRVASASC